jgi:chromosome partitioning protein
MQEINDTKITASEAAQFLGVSLQHIHKQLKEQNLPYSKNQNRIFFGYQTARKIFNIDFKKRVISFQIVKGGTGKTSITHSFALRANLYGAKVLCIDIDQQGNLSEAFGINAKNSPVLIDVLNNAATIKDAIITIIPGLDILPSRIENAVLDNYLMLSKFPLDQVYVDLIKEVHDDYDIILIDCPPALGQSVAAATLASDTVIAPLTPEQFSLSGLKISFEEIQTISKRFKKDIVFKIVLNKFDTRTALSAEVLNTILNYELFKSLMCNTFIRNCQEFPNMIYSGSNIFSTLKNTTAKEDIDLFTKEILGLNPSHKEQLITN